MDAVARFREAVRQCQTAEEQARAGGSRSIDADAFEEAWATLGEAMPGLPDIMRARALLLKGHCAHWLQLHTTSQMGFADFMASLAAPRHPRLEEGLACAREGRDLLGRSGGDEQELSWADSVVKTLEEYCET